MDSSLTARSRVPVKARWLPRAVRGFFGLAFVPDRVMRHVNTALFVLIVAINLYLIVAPLVPGVLLRIEKSDHTHGQKLSGQLHQPVPSSADGNLSVNSPATAPRTPPPSVPGVPAENRLVVPSMLLDTPIFDGNDISTLRKGLWRRPNTSTPDRGGNTVIVGHRFTYTNPRGLFYSLDKVQRGDEMAVFWQGKRYLYRVTRTVVVAPTEVEVEAPTDNPQLTLYTCTPLWRPTERLVVVADLETN
jgi:sortase A